MRYLAFFLLLIVQTGFVEKPGSSQKKILLFGTTHSFQPGHDEQFEVAISSLADFKPRMILVETIPVWDTVSLQKAKLKQLAGVASIMTNAGLNARLVEDSLKYYRKKALKKKATSFIYSRLAFFYYLSKDFLGNSDYYWFRSGKKLNSQEELHDSLFNKYSLEKKSTEFSSIIFPLAERLNISELYGVDDRSDYPVDIKAQNETQSKLITSPKGKKLLALYLKLQNDYALSEKQGRIIPFLNDTIYQNLISDLITNTYPEVLTDEAAKKMKELWERRNRSIAERIVSVIKNNPGNKRVLVAFGAAHIKLLKNYLKELLPGYDISLYRAK